MTRLYGDLLLVAEDVDSPRCFIWRGTTYRVQEVLSTWHLRDRWWEGIGPRAGATPTAQESNRHFYRLECTPALLCELYYDTVSDRWVIDQVYD